MDNDLVYDVSYELSNRTTMTALSRTAREACVLLVRYPQATVRARKLLPCAQRRLASDARIATPLLTGPSPVTGQGE